MYTTKDMMCMKCKSEFFSNIFCVARTAQLGYLGVSARWRTELSHLGKPSLIFLKSNQYELFPLKQVVNLQLIMSRKGKKQDYKHYSKSMSTNTKVNMQASSRQANTMTVSNNEEAATASAT